MVDDDEDDYVLIRDLLAGMEGLSLGWADGYAAALEALSGGSFDVCLVDYRLGERSGLELLREAAAREHKAPMILLTGRGGREVDLEAMRAGAADYLLKGRIDAPTLERSIRYAFARALRALGESERRFRSLVQNASDIVTVLGSDGTVRYQSPAIERTLGYRPEELVGENALAYVHPDDREEIRSVLSEALGRDRVTRRTEYRFRHKDGSWRWIESVGTDLSDDPAVGGLVVNSRDVTERKALEEELAYRASHDPLTGLPSRPVLMDRLRRVMENGKGVREGRFALLFVDLDNFKVINDSLGHQAGDDLLVAVAERFRGLLQPGWTIARTGGDEFAVLLERVAGAEEATRAADLLIESLREPFTNLGGDFVVTCSVGIVLGTRGRGDPTALLRDADTAMYAAKGAGRDRRVIFDPSMNRRAVERLKLERDLRTALHEGELKLCYQPKVSLETGEIVGLEALARWQHPERGLIIPEAFIPLAEETGLIIPLGRQMIRESCRQAGTWQALRPHAPALEVSVNVSARQFRHPDLGREIFDTLEEFGMRPRDLMLEITESVVQDDPECAATILRALKALGIRLEIDDFGTGYSSLSYLKDLPVDGLKVDRSFVAGLGDSAKDAAIARAIVTLARTLGLRTVAEGVETPQQLAQVREMGCDLAQGLYFAGPFTGDEVARLLSCGSHPWPCSLDAS